jgi:hypothetical protein
MLNDQFVRTFNNTKQFPTMQDVAREMGLSVQTVKNKAVALRRTKEYAGKIVNRNGVELPMSENVSRITEATAEECIEALRTFALLNPERQVTRDKFRREGPLAESAWNQHFGSFHEFRRQAQLELSRQQHQHERNLAKHVSVDHYRRLNVDRRDWADRYVRANSNRFKTILVCSDLHDKEIDLFYLRVLIDTAKRVQPDVIVFNGDVLDLPEFGKYGVDPREWDVTGRIRFTHDNIFAPLRKACPNAQMDFIEGNHEARLLRHMADATPALRSVLADLHGMTVAKLLGLDKFEINYIAKADLGAFTKRDFERELANNYKVYFDTVLCHHFPHARNMGLPGVNGHHHRHQVWSEFSPIYGAYEWHQLGSGHKRSASYCEGERWHNGFALVNVDTHTRATSFDYVAITDFAVSGGRWYYRDASETDASVPKKILTGVSLSL